MSQTMRRTFVLTNPNGLHMRPIQAFVEQANRFTSQVTVGKTGADETHNGKSVIHLLGIGAEKGTEIFVEVTGPDADAAMSALAQVLETIYDPE
jgi:phosphocarrier protein HPr